MGWRSWKNDYAVYERAIKACSKNTWLGKAQTAAKELQAGNLKTAQRLASEASALNPKDARPFIVLAEAYLRDNQDNKAMQAITKALEIEPDEANLYFASGAIYLREKKIVDAIDIINRGLKIDPNNATAWFDLGNAFLMKGEPKIALGHFKKASSINGDFSEAINNQGLALVELGDTAGAKAAFRNSLKVKELAETKLALGSLLYKADAKSLEARQLIKDALEEAPKLGQKKTQQENLWGKKLIRAAEVALNTLSVKKTISTTARESLQEKCLKAADYKGCMDYYSAK